MSKLKSKKMIPADTIEKWLRDPEWRVRQAAMNSCAGRTDIPADTIEKWLRDPDCDVRQAAMNACAGRTDIPTDTIEKGLRDPDWRVRQAAMKIAEERGITDIPPYRAVNPPEKVYKKCEGGVIVVAHIPDDAEVRGTPNGKCRANKAEIVEIIGDYCGEPVGISKHDGTVWYYEGDVVEVEDFDFSNEDCSTGFHFFCTREAAESY